ncbi:hypothetical protein CHS0354_020192 [Potamilus streckersoni]|uniref:CCAAT/enhancer-binding protein zeta n=1 Tax=Potamilus streckersoni TaxID=2493646 RepID=A0AAE0VYA6_9BIVA|nr:hypothetical protein CHS0354_020192 [Potamilus streckersoni]
MADKGKEAQKTRGKKSDLQLHDILELGGNKEDLALLQDVDSGDEEEALEGMGHNSDEDPVNRDELKEFIQDLEIYKYRPAEFQKEVKKKERKIKLLEVPLSGKDDDDEKVQENTIQPQKERNKYRIQHDEVSSTSDSPEATFVLSTYIKAHKPQKHLLIKSGGQWLDDDKTSMESKETQELSDSLLKQMEQFAAKLLGDEIAIYNKQKELKKKSDVGWMKTVLSSGTLADKMAALTLLVQESPIHNLLHLDTLISMVRKKGRRESMLSADSLKDLFLSDILPSNRKLRTFSQHSFHLLHKLSGGNHEALDRRVLMWYCEAQIKDKYAAFTKALEAISHDTVLTTKQKTLNIIYQLLVNKPEREKELLTMLINKVGDPDYKLASKTSHLLTKLVEQHPNMKTVVVREVEQLMFRPNIPVKAQYYSVCFLNQLALSSQEKDLALRLIKMYFAFFKAFVKKGEVDSKMMSGLLKGVNRAYPHAKVDADYISEQMNTLYKIVHIVNFNTSLQALMLLYQVMDSSQNVSDRYYSSLYRKMLDPALKNSSKCAMFLNLLFKSLKKDMSERRVKAFIKRLLQICCHQNPQFTCGCLVLLSEVLKHKPGIQMNFSHVEEDSDEEEHFVDLPLPEDIEVTSKPFHDVDDSDDEDGEKSNKDDDDPDKTSSKKPSWVHRKNLGAKAKRDDYDPCHRNPQYCHAENECVWELKKLSQHFHPSVALFASQLLQGESIKYDGDPLLDFSLIRFLDRFVYKNPKQINRVKKPGMILTRGKETSTLKGVKQLAISSDSYRNLVQQKIPVEERFFHRYFTQKAAKGRRGKELDEDSEASSISDTEFDDYLDKYEEQFDEDKDNLKDLEQMDLDFAGAFSKKKPGKRKKGDEDESDEDDDDLDEDLSDEEVDFEDDEDFAAAFGNLDNDDDGDIQDSYKNKPDFNEKDIEFSDNDIEHDPSLMKEKKKKLGKSKPNKNDGFGPSGLFSAAEEFSHLIDDSANSGFDMTGANAMSNKDKADVKQLKWEMQRDQWIKGVDWKKKKTGKKRWQPNKGHGSKHFKAPMKKKRKTE